MVELSKEDLDGLLKRYKKTEVLKQYERHLPYLLSGLDGKEEYKSRLAFADTYCMELQQIHEKLYGAFGLPDRLGNGEFAYLENTTLREELGAEYSNLIELMKDYASYRYETGGLKKQEYEKLLTPDTEKEQAFRKQALTNEEKNFLLPNGNLLSPVASGIRDCRKWMLRNCNKSGLFNDTGSKRGFTDAFCKRPAQAQCAMLYQVEKGYYKYGGETQMQMNEALGGQYIPDLIRFKSKMIKSKYNPYNLYLKPYGEYFYWNKLEQSMKKIDTAYQQYKARPVVGNGENIAIEGENPLQKKSEDKIWKLFKEGRKEYEKLIDKYAEERTAENLDKLRKQGNTMQRLAKLTKLRGGFEERQDQYMEICSFAAVTRDMNKSLRKVDGPDLKKVFHERVTDWSDLGALGEWGADLLFTGGKWVATNYGGVISTLKADKNIIEQMSEAKGAAHVSIGFRWAGLLASAYTTIKEGFMSAVTFGRRKKAVKIKQMNKEQPENESESREKEEASAQTKDAAEENKNKNSKEEKNTKENKNVKEDHNAKENAERNKNVHGKKEHINKEMDKDQKQINAMAKISKKSNAKKSWSHLSKFGFAAAGLGFTIVGFAGIAALPVTIAAGAVASIGVATKYAVDYYKNKNTAKKTVDTQAKLQDEGYEKQTDQHGNKKRYIDVKAEERKKLLEDKKGRFTDGNKSLDVLEEYINNDRKLKDRIRQNIATQNGNLSIYTYTTQVKRDYAMEAYRHVFLKDPDGEINDENLLKPAEVEKYCSLTKENLKATAQREQDARKRVMYRNLLVAEGLSVEAPGTVQEARMLFVEKKKNGRKDKDTENLQAQENNDKKKKIGLLK